MEPNNYAIKTCWISCKARAQLHKLPAALRPAQRQPGVFLSVVLDVFIGVQYFELVLLRRQRRILYLLIEIGNDKSAVAGKVTALLLLRCKGRIYAAREVYGKRAFLQHPVHKRH